MERFFERRPVRFVLDIARVFLNRRGSRSAAELAYFLVLSLFPLLIMLNAVVGMLHLNVTEVIAALDDFIPAQAAAVVADYVTYISGNQSRGLFWAGLVMTLTSSSAAFRALLNVTADIYRKPAFPGFRAVVASVVFSLAFLAIMYVSIIVLLTGNWFFSLLKRFLHIAPLPGSWSWMRYWLLFGLVFLFLALFYRATALRERPGPRCSPAPPSPPSCWWRHPSSFPGSSASRPGTPWCTALWPRSSS